VDFILVFDGVDPCEPTKVINEAYLVPEPPPSKSTLQDHKHQYAQVVKVQWRNCWNYKKEVDGSGPFDKHCTH
jgi:hypothetical protein